MIAMFQLSLNFSNNSNNATSAGMIHTPVIYTVYKDSAKLILIDFGKIGSAFQCRANIVQTSRNLPLCTPQSLTYFVLFSRW